MGDEFFYIINNSFLAIFLIYDIFVPCPFLIIPLVASNFMVIIKDGNNNNINETNHQLYFKALIDYVNWCIEIENTMREISMHENLMREISMHENLMQYILIFMN